MAMIADYPTKKAFKEAITANPDTVHLSDPSVMTSWLRYNTRHFPITLMHNGDLITVTNHPKQSWFAEVTRRADGTFLVK